MGVAVAGAWSTSTAAAEAQSRGLVLGRVWGNRREEVGRLERRREWGRDLVVAAAIGEAERDVAAMRI